MESLLNKEPYPLKPENFPVLFKKGFRYRLGEKTKSNQTHRVNTLSKSKKSKNYFKNISNF